jgi:hypothetical protein
MSIELRARGAYARAGGQWLPDRFGQYNIGGKEYCALFDRRVILAVFRIRNDGILKRLKRWPPGIS